MSYLKKSLPYKMNAYKYGKMSRLYYMYSANFMKKSGFYRKNGMRYMNIYKGFLA